MLKPVLCNTIPKAISNTVTFHHICAWSILQLLQLAWLIDGPQSNNKKKRSRQPAATTLQAPGPLTQSIKEETITLNKHMLHKHTHTHKHTQSNCSSLIMKHVHYMNRKADKQTIIHASSLIQRSVHYSHCFGADSVERTSGTKKCLSHWLQKTLSSVRSLVSSRQTWGSLSQCSAWIMRQYGLREWYWGKKNKSHNTHCQNSLFFSFFAFVSSFHTLFSDRTAFCILGKDHEHVRFPASTSHLSTVIGTVGWWVAREYTQNKKKRKKNSGP